MRIEEAYLQFVNQVNRNATNNNINVDLPRFILLFNDICNRYIEWVLEKRNEDDIRYVSKFLVPNKQLTRVINGNSSESYELPDDYFDLANLHAYATKGECKNKRVTTFEIKGEDTEELLTDVSNEPSFEYRETFYLINSGNVTLYKKDFSFDRVLLDYYRYPKKVDITGYIHRDTGFASVDVDPELDDKAVGRILVAMNMEFSAINGDGQRFQVDNSRLFTKA